MKISIPIEYILRKTRTTWADLRFGLDNGFVDEADVVQAAVNRVSHDSNPNSVEIELAGLFRTELNRVSHLLNELTREPETIDIKVKNKWLYLILSWLYDQRASLDDPLAMVEDVYADFGHPEEIACFIRYMPPFDNYRPQDHTHEENLDRLYQLWNEYLMLHECDNSRQGGMGKI